jgi:thiopeptide-type bacteriocin biosynthesis protein
MKVSSKAREENAMPPSSRCPTCGARTLGRRRRQWLQVNLAPPEGNDADGWSAPALRALVQDLETLRGPKRVDCVFFMRKPPGLRVRFRMNPDASDAVVAKVRASCKRLKASGRCGRIYFSCYEPETFQFGGPRAMELAHRYFAGDTKAWCEHSRLLAEGRAVLGPDVLSLSVLNDLFQRTLRGSEDEVWDTWCNLSLIHGRRPELVERPLRAPTLDELARVASPPEGELLRQYERRNRAFALGLQRAHERGELLYAMRLILPFVALFHWNRYALSPAQRELICGSMYTRLHTKRGLHGFGATA